MFERRRGLLSSLGETQGASGTLCAGITVLTLICGGARLPARAQTNPLDCERPAPDAEPDSPEWHVRDLHNVLCAERRLVDAVMHPVAPLPVDFPLYDAYREPSRHDGVRFRYHETTVTNREGQTLEVELYRPCAAGMCSDLPEELRTFEPPYPAVIIVHGGFESVQELHWWATQSLAEAGYMAVSLNAIHGDDEFFEDTTDVLDWLTATPSATTAAGEHNPFWDELDRDHIGVAGHSGGGATSNRLGHEDPRVSAVVAWDRSGRYALPENLEVPSLFLIADYGFVPERRSEPPDPEGSGDKFRDFDRLREAGLDTMKIVLRAATHLDWVPMVAAASQYGEAVSLYYTLAWFDRYLKGADDPQVAEDAYLRLTADVFDDSADRHNISQGFFDPVQWASSGDPLYGGNVPYFLDGMTVADRLSFYFLSKCDVGVPDSTERAVSEDVRTDGCTVDDGGP